MEQTEGAEGDTKERELIDRGGWGLKEDYTVKKAVELLDAPSRNAFLM
jgi:hypothetical protein